MNFELSPTVTGIKIAAEAENITFKNKIFSLSSELRDSHGDVIAQLKRKGWWRLKFLLTTNSGDYTLLSKWGEFHLVSKNTGEKFNTNSVVEFYTDKGVRLTEFSKKKVIGTEYNLVIHNEEHAIALLMASCLIYRTALEPNGLIVG